MDKPMKNIEELYIIGRPIKTDIGNLYPIKVKDYPDFVQYMGVLDFTKLDLVTWLTNEAKQNKSMLVLLEIAKKISLFEFITMFKNEVYDDLYLYGLYLAYKSLFEFCFKEDVFDKIKNNDEFEQYIELIHKINGFKYHKPHPNPAIERRNQIGRMIKQRKNGDIDFESIYTSVEVAIGRNPNDMTLYQFFKIFERIAQFKNYDASILYSLFSSKAEIESWCKSTKERKKENYITEKQLKTAINNQGLHKRM